MLISNQNSKSYYSKTCRAPIFQWKAPKKSPCRLFAPATARNRRIPCPIRRIADENKQRKQFKKKIVNNAKSLSFRLRGCNGKYEFKEGIFLRTRQKRFEKMRENLGVGEWWELEIERWIRRDGAEKWASWPPNVAHHPDSPCQSHCFCSLLGWTGDWRVPWDVVVLVSTLEPSFSQLTTLLCLSFQLQVTVLLVIRSY